MNDYTVEYLIKANAYCETYRVADDDGSPFFLKLFIIKNIPEKLLTRDGAVREIEHCKRLMHENIISYITSGTLMIPEGVCHYMVTVYFSGELLVEKLEREGSLTASESTRIVTGILHALQYMHDKHGLMHNDITPRNIMLSAKTDGIPELIDMGHVSGATSGVTPFDTSDLEVQYSANSTFAGMYDESTDVYSAVAVLYAMLTGRSPWAIDGSLTRREAIREVKKLRKQPPAVFKRVIVKEFEKLGLTEGISAVHLNALWNAVQKNIGGKTIEFPGGYTAELRAGTLTLK